jgi:osmoprotectant transport system permease protein
MTDTPTQTDGIDMGNILTRYNNPAGRQWNHLINHIYDGGLTAPRRSGQADECTLSHIEVKICDGDGPIRVTLPDPPKRNHRLRRHRLRPTSLVSTTVLSTRVGYRAIIRFHDFFTGLSSHPGTVGCVRTISWTASWLGDSANWNGDNGIIERFVEHVTLTATSIGFACALALPVGLWLGHLGRGRILTVGTATIERVVPAFAVLVLLAVGPLGFGSAATVAALILVALPPLLSTAYTGVRDVDTAVRQAAVGMGMSGGQLLRRVELPLAAPLLLTGLQIAAARVVATATVAAVIGGGGLGQLILDGLTRHDNAEAVAGTVLLVALALIVQGMLLGLGRLVRPAGHGHSRHPPL